MKKNKNTIEIVDIFKQFVAKLKLNEDLKKIIKFSFEIEKEKKGRFLSNKGGF